MRRAPAIILAALAALAAQADLPYDAEVEYLESTGTQYIDMGFTISNPSKLKVVMQSSNIPVIGMQHQNVGGGTWLGFSKTRVYYNTWNNKITWQADSSEHVYIWDGSSGFYIDDVKQNSFTAAVGSDTDISSISWKLGAVYQIDRSVYTLSASFNIKYFKVYIDNQLIRDSIPVRVGSVGYLYDRANPTGGPLGNGLYGNAGTGAFVLGPDVRVVAKWPRPPHLLSLLRAAADPTRMRNRPTARATAEGGPELPALLDVNCPLDASGDWSSSVTIPAGTVTQRGNAVICVNVTTDCPATLRVGGATKEVPAGSGMQVFNLEVAAAPPATLAVSVHTDPGAQVELALAINPWIEFKTLGGMLPEPTFGTSVPGSVTNDWALYAIRGELAAGGRLTAVASLWHADGYRIAQTNALETSWTAGAFPANIRVRNSWSRVGGVGGTAPLDRYGIKAWPRRLADDELDRIYNLDRQELQRRGLWGAFPPSPANP